jgi:putative transposase
MSAPTISYRKKVGDEVTRLKYPRSMNGEPRAYNLPRLPRESYQGDAVVHWTLTVFDRATGWLNDGFHLKFREIMLHTASREGLFCPAYCLMPDHIHLIWIGLKRDTDQRNGMTFLRTHLEPFLVPFKFQHQAYDHVLRDEERKRNAFARICFYILANPVRAGLMKETEKWPFCGAIVPGYPALHPLDKSFWPLFWKLYMAARSPDAGNLKK